MFKLMTLNVNHYGDSHGPWQLRKVLIAEVMAVLDADVIALQAVAAHPTIENGVDQATQLTAMLPQYRHVVFCPTSSDGDGLAYGSAMLSRFPVTDTRIHRLSLVANPEDQSERALLIARVEIDGQALYVANGHFSWVTEANDRNAQETLSHLGNLPGPVVFCGDLNALAGSSGMRRFASDGWCDAWTSLHPDLPGYSFEADRPSQRIDYVWVKGSWKERLHAIELVGAPANEAGTRLSDHLGLLATFR